MGVAISDLLVRETIKFDQLAGKVLVVDAFNILYQFLTTIRTPDGTPLKDSQGRVTSHLVGLYSRTTNLMDKGMRLAFVFDGPKPVLKSSEVERRKALKDEAAEKLADAVERRDVDAMKKFSSRTVTLTPEMIAEAKELLDALGIPLVQAASEAEAQASLYVKEGIAYAVVSQDADCLMFGAPRMIRNLSVSSRRRKPGTPFYVTVEPELVDLQKTLDSLELTHEQLVTLGILVGTDFNPGGIKGIGPKKALKLVKEHKTPKEVFEAADWEEHQPIPWEEIFELIMNMPTNPVEKLEWKGVDKARIEGMLRSRGFAEERFAILDKLGERQQGLGEFF